MLKKVMSVAGAGIDSCLLCSTDREQSDPNVTKAGDVELHSNTYAKQPVFR